MARDRANINTAIWTDDDWRELTRDEHWLYTLLLTHGTLSYAGVADWRPGRLAQNSSDTTADDVERIGALLQSKRFILIDPETEEVLVRSFLRHDGLLKQPKLAVSMVNAYGSVSSRMIRKVIIHELQRLHDEYPEWRAFAVDQVTALLKLSGADMATFTPGFTPPLTPAFTPNATQGQDLPTSTATTTSTSPSGDRESAPKRATRLPDGWTPSQSVYDAMAAESPAVDLDSEHRKFTDHWKAQPGAKGVKLDWDATWRNWIRRAAEYAAPRGYSTPDQRRAENVHRISQHNPWTPDQPTPDQWGEGVRALGR